MIKMKNEGFFSLSEIKQVTDLSKRTTCVSCGLYRQVLSPRMKPYGRFKKGILCIGEAPGEEEDRKGKQWQGKVGRLLKRTMRRLGIDLFSDCLNYNSINCRPTTKEGNNRTPTDHEIACCRKKVIEVINHYKPKVVILFGNSPIKSIIGHRWKKDLGGITKWRGWAIPDRDFRTWICPVYHPSFVSRKDSPEVMKLWKEDLKRAIKMAGKPFPVFDDDKSKIEIVKDLKFIGQLPRTCCFDYETTGLKPFRKGHRII